MTTSAEYQARLAAARLQLLDMARDLCEETRDHEATMAEMLDRRCDNATASLDELKRVRDEWKERAESAEAECDRLREQVRTMLGWNDDQLCVGCGKVVESDRRCYARPTCHACLPPPAALPVVKTKPWNTCISCQAVVDLDGDEIHDGADVECSGCGLLLTAIGMTDGRWCLDPGVAVTELINERDDWRKRAEVAEATITAANERAASVTAELEHAESVLAAALGDDASDDLEEMATRLVSQRDAMRAALIGARDALDSTMGDSGRKESA